MIVSDFTKYDLDHFREYCNFVNEEKDVFELRSQGVPLEQIAELLNMSVRGIKKKSRKVNAKIKTVLDYREKERNNETIGTSQSIELQQETNHIANGEE